MDLQRRWESLKNSRRELVTVKKVKPESAHESGRKECSYFKQLSFLLPVCKTKAHEEAALAGPAKERTTECENQLPGSLTQKKRKAPASEEEVLLQTLARSIEKKANASDDPDKHFLLSLLPHFKNLPKTAKQDAKGEFTSILKRYKQHSALVSQQFLAPSPHFFPDPTSSRNQAPHYFSPNIHPSYSAGTQYQLAQIDTVSHESAAALQTVSTKSDTSSICDEYFFPNKILRKYIALPSS